jgi:hypothetical protein
MPEIIRPAFRTGRLPPTSEHLKKRLWLRDYYKKPGASALPVSPATNWRAAAAAGLATMLGNSQYGDCSIAGILHVIMTWLANETGQPVVFSTQQAVNLYFQLTGGADNGLALETVLKFFQQTGWNGYKIGPYLAIDPSDQETIEAAISCFGPLYCGINLPSGWESNTKTWDSNAGYPVGGHCVAPIDESADGLVTSSWGQLPAMTFRGCAQYCDEMYVILAPSIWASTGEAPNGLDLEALQSDFQALTA